MSSGVQRTRTGSIDATNAVLTIEQVGFRPKHVKVFNATSLAELEWWDALADDSGVKTVAAGTRTNPSADGITPTDTGFELGTLADVNDTAGERLHWIASE